MVKEKEPLPSRWHGTLLEIENRVEQGKSWVRRKMEGLLKEPLPPEWQGPLLKIVDKIKIEGKHPFRGLLDKTKHPDGPQFCYPIGTDVRISAN